MAARPYTVHSATRRNAVSLFSVLCTTGPGMYKCPSTRTNKRPSASAASVEAAGAPSVVDRTIYAIRRELDGQLGFYTACHFESRRVKTSLLGLPKVCVSDPSPSTRIIASSCSGFVCADATHLSR